jgi:hypothetical protein
MTPAHMLGAGPAMPPVGMRTAPDGDYLWLPTQLLDTLYDSPLAVSLYMLIARRWLADGGSDGVPLSDADVMRYDPQLSSRGALMRAVARLETAGWIATVRTRGAKTRYTPTWGRQRGGVRSWSKAAPSLNRGRVQTIRVSRRLLDDYLGRLIPHPRVPAQVERYGTTPLLSLKDIGVYILRQHQRTTTPAPALDAAQLCHEERVLAVPPTRETLARTELSEQGLRRMGLLKPGPQPRPAATDMRPPVFFVSRHMIGHMIGQVIAATNPAERRLSAAERPETPAPAPQSNVTGMSGMSGMNHYPPTPFGNTQEGGQVIPNESQEERRQGEPPMTTTKDTSARRARRPQREREIMSTESTSTAQRLATLGVRPAQCGELAAMPLATIEAAIADAQARPKVRDHAAWVVSLVRDVRDHGWDLALRTRGAAPDNSGPSLAALQASMERAKASGIWTVDADDPAEPSTPAAPPITDDTAALLTRARASGFFGPREEPDLPAPAADVLPPAGAVVVTTASMAPDPLPSAERPPLPPASAADPGRPAWIAPDAWQALPVLVRGVLRGARLVGHRVVAADRWRQSQLERYEPTLTCLIAAAIGDEAGQKGRSDATPGCSDPAPPDRSGAGGHSHDPPRRR